MSYVKLYNQTLGIPYMLRVATATTTEYRAIDLSSGSSPKYNSSSERTAIGYSSDNGYPTQGIGIGLGWQGFDPRIVRDYGVMASVDLAWNETAAGHYTTAMFPDTGALFKTNVSNAYNLNQLFPPSDFFQQSNAEYVYNVVNADGDIDTTRVLRAVNSLMSGRTMRHTLIFEYNGLSWNGNYSEEVDGTNAYGLSKWGSQFWYLAEPKRPFFSVDSVPSGVCGLIAAFTQANGRSARKSAVFHAWIGNFFAPGAVTDEDTNEQGGTSGTGGGGGNFDDTSDQINVPALPTLSATRAGFVTLYKPSLSNLLDLAAYLWSANPLNMLIQYFSNPMDIIIGLGIVPVSAPASSSGYPSAGTIVVPFDIPIYDSQYYEYDCGSIQIMEFWGSALDYSPYTSADIYLPYIGVRSLDVDEVMGKTIGIKYHIDLYGGAVCAFITVDGSVRYQFTGNCIQQVPVNAANYDALVQNLISVACVVGTGIAAAGSAGAAAAVGEEASAIGAGSATTAGAAAKGWLGSEYSEVRALGFKEWAADGGGTALANCTMSTVMSAKPVVERTGAVNATNGQLAVQTPFITLRRPRQSLPENYKHYGGYPSNITAKLGDLVGFTKVDSIRINDLAATEPEVAEIYALLKKGVII